MHDYERALKFLKSETKFEPVYAAMDAVKKQIPQPADNGRCPSCGAAHNGTKHCPNCGQAVGI